MRAVSRESIMTVDVIFQLITKYLHVMEDFFFFFFTNCSFPRNNHPYLHIKIKWICICASELNSDTIKILLNLHCFPW